MTRRFTSLLATLLLTLNATAALAQGSARSSLSGIVADDDGGVLPGASVVITRDSTGVTMQVVTNEAGVFAVPALDAGTYTVTVTLQGFKTAVIKDVKLVAGTPANLPNITLALGTLEESSGKAVRLCAARRSSSSTSKSSVVPPRQRTSAMS